MLITCTVASALANPGTGLPPWRATGVAVVRPVGLAAGGAVVAVAATVGEPITVAVPPASATGVAAGCPQAVRNARSSRTRAATSWNERNEGGIVKSFPEWHERNP